jgi:hypothetical protein
MKTALIYVNTNKQVGDTDHLKVFASEEAAERWLRENDPEGVAFEYPVIGAGEECFAWRGRLLAGSRFNAQCRYQY